MKTQYKILRQSLSKDPDFTQQLEELVNKDKWKIEHVASNVQGMLIILLSKKVK